MRKMSSCPHWSVPGHENAAALAPGALAYENIAPAEAAVIAGQVDTGMIGAGVQSEAHVAEVREKLCVLGRQIVAFVGARVHVTN